MDDPCGLGGCSASVFGLFWLKMPSWHKQHTYALITTQPRFFSPPKYHQHTSIMLQIDIGCWNWGLEEVGFWPILAPLLLLSFFKGKWHLTNHWVFSLQFFCNDVCLLQEHPNTKNHVIWCSCWSGVDIWLWKVGFTLRPIRHGPPDRAFSSSSAVKSLQAGLPSNSKLEKAPSGDPCQNHTHFGPQITPFGKLCCIKTPVQLQECHKAYHSHWNDELAM